MPHTPEQKRRYYKKNREKILKQGRDRYRVNKEEGIKRTRKWYNLGKWRKRIYGISNEDYQRMFMNQNGCCAICGKHQMQEKQALCVDHDHKTGKIRGLLCKRCNHYITILDDKEFCKKAKDYFSYGN